jgi:hypothetical protein
MMAFETNLSRYMSLHISSAALSIFTGGFMMVGKME